MSYKIGDKVYRRTINDKVLAEWTIVAVRGTRLWKEYYSKHSSAGMSDLLVIEKERNLFKVPEEKSND